MRVCVSVFPVVPVSPAPGAAPAVWHLDGEGSCRGHHVVRWPGSQTIGPMDF